MLARLSRNPQEKKLMVLEERQKKFGEIDLRILSQNSVSAPVYPRYEQDVVKFKERMQIEKDIDVMKWRTPATLTAW